jgi:ubiquinone/menaquinone biosynthesis C-methylase UbiE
MSDIPSYFDLWNAPSVVGHYTRKNFLYLPEMRLLNLLRDKWSTMQMLDIGIGGGRTTLYFAELCERYVGVDYAPQMVEASKARLAGRWTHDVTFAQADATAMPEFADASFDFVLFSFNGIDCMSWEAREKALIEMKRVCKPGGTVAFSSHSLHSIPAVYHCRRRRHPLAWWKERQRVASVTTKNEPLNQLMNSDRAMFYDGTVGDNHLAHVCPENQIQQLHQLGYGEVRLFSHLDGLELTSPEAMREDKHSWILYVATVL